MTERVEYCPVCKEKNILSSIKRIQTEEEKYWMSCTRTRCYYLEEYEGRSVVSREYLTMRGLPGDLLQHMDIFQEDVNKIIRLCKAECLKINLPSVYNLKEHQESSRVLAKYHGLNYSVSLNKDANCQSTKPKHKTHTLGHDIETDARTNLPRQSQSTDDEFLTQFLQSFNSSEKAEDKDIHEPKTKESPQARLQNCNLYDSVKELADSLVEDLPISYQNEIKLAFSKIEGYNFPQDFAKNTHPDKVPSFKVLEEEERKEQMRVKEEKVLADHNITELETEDLSLLFL